MATEAVAARDSAEDRLPGLPCTSHSDAAMDVMSASDEPTRVTCSAGMR